MHLIKKLDSHLLDLAWSLWTEVGVAGASRNHQDILILIEELIIFTSVVAEIDPRLRDESIDWCSQFGRFISISRLKSLIKEFGNLVDEPFSKYAATMNEVLNTNWPTFSKDSPFKVSLSGKSVLRPYASPALLNIRARSLFGTGARADLITFFLVHKDSDFSIAETAEIGYTKRNLSEVLDDLHFSKTFDRFMLGNQQRYRIKKHSPIVDILKPFPKYVSWRLVFKVLISLRACIKRIDNMAESTQVVELRNCLKELDDSLQRLGLTPPLFQSNFSTYLKSFNEWILEWAASLSQGKFGT